MKTKQSKLLSLATAVVSSVLTALVATGVIPEESANEILIFLGSVITAITAYLGWDHIPDGKKTQSKTT